MSIVFFRTSNRVSICVSASTTNSLLLHIYFHFSSFFSTFANCKNIIMQPNIIKPSMNNGLIMGVLFSLNFILSIQKNYLFVFLSYFVISTIVVGMYRMSIRYRDTECEGVLSYRKAFSLILYTFFFAALISSVVKYVYFQFICPTYLESMMQDSLKVLSGMNFKIDTEAIAQMETTLKPASFSLQYIWVNVFVGSLVAFVMAFFVKKNPPISTEDKE